MIIEFLLATTLNMSLPEFQPQEDFSGNVIVSSIDDETKEIVAEEIPFEDISISDNESDRVLQGISLEHDRTEEEIILRSGDGELLINNTLGSKFINYQNGVGSIVNSTSYYSIYYVELIANNDYYLDSNAQCFYSFSLDGGSECFLKKGNFTPTQNCYAICQTTNTFNVYLVNDNSGGDVSGDEPGGDVSGDEPGGNISADLTNVENKLDNIIILQRSILLVLLVSFLFPIIKSSVNLLKGGKDV